MNEIIIVLGLILGLTIWTQQANAQNAQLNFLFSFDNLTALRQMGFNSTMIQQLQEVTHELDVNNLTGVDGFKVFFTGCNPGNSTALCHILPQLHIIASEENENFLKNATGAWGKFTDSYKTYSIDYPRGWDITYAANRFEPLIIKFTSGDTGFGIGVKHTVNTTDPAKDLTPSKNMPFGSSLFQDVECVKYHIDGEKTCSIIFTTTPTFGQQVYQVVESYINSKMYFFAMSSTQNEFDTYLPTFTKMLTSFKAPA